LWRNPSFPWDDEGRNTKDSSSCLRRYAFEEKEARSKFLQYQVCGRLQAFEEETPKVILRRSGKEGSQGGEEVTIEGPRVLNKTIPVFYGDYVTPSPPALPYMDGVGSSWGLVGDNTWVSRTYYDLSGYNRKSLTAFFQGVDIQEGTWIGTSQNQLNVVDLITTEFMTDEACVKAAAPAFDGGDAPGFPESVYDMDQVIYGRRRTWLRTDSAQVGLHTPYYGSASYGTCAAASADKLHITRIISSTTAEPDAFIRVSPAVYVLAIIVAEEKELAYLMRQKRSYELATGP